MRYYVAYIKPLSTGASRSQNKEKGARIHVIGRAIHRRLTSNQKEGTTLLKFIYGQLYNGKLSQRYGHAPKDECPLCHKPDPCKKNAG